MTCNGKNTVTVVRVASVTPGVTFATLKGDIHDQKGVASVTRMTQEFPRIIQRRTHSEKRECADSSKTMEKTSEGKPETRKENLHQGVGKILND